MPSVAVTFPRENAADVARMRGTSFLAAIGLGLMLAVMPALPGHSRGAPESFADLAEQISPSVVNITTSSVIASPMDGGPQMPEGSPFDEFFRDFMERNGDAPDGPQRSEALGSGFVISEDGYIVTNNHVIQGADEIEIEFFSGNRLDAKLIGTDPKTDIALLKVESPTPLPFVSFGDSNLMRVGDWVVAMGNPLGQGFSVSAGIVSARNRELSGTYDDYIQTDAAINRGNSGGPLFNMDGQVIGVNTAILSPNGGSIGIGFSMASNVVTKVVDQLREFGETRRGWLGVRIQDVTPDVAEAMGLAVAEGALITDVPDGPAKDSGLLAGDVITSFDGGSVKDVRDLTRRVADAPIGEAVPVVILREGKTETVQVTLGRREEAEAETTVLTSGEPAKPAEAMILGMTVTELDDAKAAELGIDPATKGLLVVKVDGTSEAFAKGLREGDLITEAGQQPVVLVKDLEDRIAEAKEGGRKSLLLLVRTGGNPRFVAVSVEDGAMAPAEE
ncbi:serine protease [Gemmobacter tilapiae]|uniref:Probable periplasmic serine endoprotease DegP-like n=2 Tax=Neogemmobacter tilapiae TaxID=875041 RepID=A0A918WN51_9RHOB|nr:serine protease [Gemmobacter tilapiae]